MEPTERPHRSPLGGPGLRRSRDPVLGIGKDTQVLFIKDNVFSNPL